MNENVTSRNELIVKWLKVLMYIAIASIVNSLINFLPFVPASVTTWIGRVIMVAMIVCMFQLAPVSERYKKAGTMRAITLVCMLISTLAFASSILTLAASILSIIAVYQEYHAHADLIADKDAKLSGKWHSLFIWGLIAGLLVSFGSMVATLILTMLEADAVRITAMIVTILSIPQLVIDVVYLLYVKKMISYFSEVEVQ